MPASCRRGVDGHGGGGHGADEHIWCMFIWHSFRASRGGLGGARAVRWTMMGREGLLWWTRTQGHGVTPAREDGGARAAEGMVRYGQGRTVGIGYSTGKAKDSQVGRVAGRFVERIAKCVKWELCPHGARAIVAKAPSACQWTVGRFGDWAKRQDWQPEWRIWQSGLGCTCRGAVIGLVAGSGAKA